MVFFGLANQAYCVSCCTTDCIGLPTPTPVFDADGRRIYEVASGEFVIVVEGAPGASGAQPAKSLDPVPPSNRPDLLIQSTRDLGNGSAKVCDKGPASQGGGGIPGIDPPDFSGNDMVTDALTDFACRFESFSATGPCTFKDASGEPKTINPDTAAQFCDAVATVAAFPIGETIVTVQLRDILGNAGPPAQIVVRVLTPTPSPTETPNG